MSELDQLDTARSSPGWKVPSWRGLPDKGLQKKSGTPIPLHPQYPQAFGSDHFGYTWHDEYTTSSWIGAWTDAASGGTQIFFGTDDDDDLISVVDLPFSFKFYEKSYTKVRISSNGLLGFDSSIDAERASFRHLSTPHEASPQSLIAPFWTDLTNVSAFYASGTDAHGQFFAVEWHECAHYDVPNVFLTFEVKLYSNGDILFLYDQLTNNPEKKSIGIEDSDNVDGLSYLVNTSGPEEDQAILITRPAQARRVKVFPSFQSNFNISGNASFKVNIRNTGDQSPNGNDTMNIQATISDPNWTVGLFAADGGASLANHDSNPLPDTGELLPGETFTMTVMIQAPLNFPAGNAVTVTLTATSSKNSDATDQVEIVNVIPVSFAHTYRNTTLGIPGGVHVELVTPFSRLDEILNSHYTGATFLLNRTDENGFLGIWENNTSGLATNLAFLGIDSAGVENSSTIQDLTSNTDRHDRWPVAATALDGSIGVAWIQTQPDLSLNTYHQNIYFAIFDQKAETILFPPFSVTADNTPYPLSQTSVYKDLQIAATEDNKFHLSWIQWHILGSIATEDIAHAVFNSSGTAVLSSQFLTAQTQGLDYSTPSMIPFISGGENRLLLLSSQRTDPDNPTYKMILVEMNSSGTVISPQEEFFNQRGTDFDGVQMYSGKIAVAWINQDTERVNFAVLGADLSKPAQPTELVNPDDPYGRRSAGRVSVAHVKNGRAVLTWMDETFRQRLYYALIEDNGLSGVIGKSIVFRYLNPGAENSIETRGSYGNAEYFQIWRELFPFVRR